MKSVTQPVLTIRVASITKVKVIYIKSERQNGGLQVLNDRVFIRKYRRWNG